MSTLLPTAEASDEELERVYENNSEPFSSIEQVERFIRAASMLRQRVPAESEHSGERYSLRDIMESLSRAQRWRAVYLMSCRRNRASNFGGLC